MKLAIFDFDGTITTKDSFEDFIFFTQGVAKTLWGIFWNSPILIAYVLKIVPNWRAKEQIFSYFYKGWDIGVFDNLARQHAQKRLPALLRPGAMEKLKWHKDAGHKVVIVSASFENYLAVWCEEQGVELLATKVEINVQNLTGKFASKNCHGEEKVNRIKAAYNLKDFDYIYAYGDTKGDLLLKEIAHEFHYKPFRD